MKNIFYKNNVMFVVILLFVNLSYSQVGINTTSPTEDLDVNGNLRVRNLNNGYCSFQ